MPRSKPKIAGSSLQTKGLIDLYRQLWNHTKHTQLLLIGLSLAIAVLAAAPLYFQQRLINGLAYGTSLQQVLRLGAAYAAASLLTIILKLWLQYRGAMLGETIVRWIRGRILAAHTRERQTNDATRAADGTVVSMLIAESEYVGLFAGEAFTTPLLEIGTLLSVLIYIAASEPLLGLFIAAVMLPQASIVMAAQRPMNPLVRTRLELLRVAADRTVDGANEWPRSTILESFDKVLDTRRRIHIFKLSSKGAANGLSALGAVGVLMLGGWLVLNGETDVGTVVAALTGMSRIDRPWKSLVKFYRTLSSVLVRYGMLTDTFR